MARPAARRGGRQIACFHVVLALALLVVFGVSFGVVFEYAALAIQILEAEIYGPTYCAITSAASVSNVTCDDGGGDGAASAPCYVVRAVPEGAGGDGGAPDDSADERRTASAILHPYYRDYYYSKECSYTLCDDSSGIGRPTTARRNKLRLLKMAADASTPAKAPVGEAGGGGRNETAVQGPATGTAVRCWLDRRKPGRAFLGLDEEAEAAAHAAAAEGNGSSSLPLSEEKAYAVLVVPPAVMLACVASLAACVAAGKVNADEVHEPVVTPNHIEIDGKWYVRSPRPRPAADDDDDEQRRLQREAERWQALRRALRR